MDKVYKAALIGATDIAKATGGHQPNLVRLQAPFERPNSVIYSFCTGCGNTLELTQEGVGKIAAVINQQLPDNLSTIYFQTASCSCCDGTDKDVSVVVMQGSG